MTADWWTAVGAALGAGFVSGAVTIALAEASAFGAAALESSSLRIAVIVAFTLGHVAGKGLWYWAGTQERRITRPSLRRWIDRRTNQTTTSTTPATPAMATWPIARPTSTAMKARAASAISAMATGREGWPSWCEVPDTPSPYRLVRLGHGLT